ncbi:MAG: hypothetical protein ACM3N0_07080 [Chloroflexota bacterium]
MAAAATAPARRAAPPTRRARASSSYGRTKTKSAPQPRRAPARRPGGHLIPIAVGTASAVRQLPDSSLVVRLTRGRAWIAVLGVLLIGIVAVNVATLSFAASAGRIEKNIEALEEENGLLRARDAARSGAARVRHEATVAGLIAAPVDQVGTLKASPHDVRVAAQRLAAAGPGH